ncbi:hypothetical protein HPB49_005979 [Dermacentor silvarum]|uniref:Uncharacterized protein n=1 Tax=Dermacentor silvarum TaxID=543639 RepID=A0ACB8D385_DERSI|nr:hypothetical protein HPB49_005979 [Dermacentor silvarum]
MDVQSQGEDLDPTTFRASEWTTILRAYKGGKPSPETLVVPLMEPLFEISLPRPGSPTYHAQQQQLRVMDAVALRSKQLASLSPDTIRVVFRPRGGLAMNGAMAQPLMQAIEVTATDRDLGEFYLQIHPTNKTFTVATPHESTALHLIQLKEVSFRKPTGRKTPEQMLRDLQTRNAEADIIAARRMDRTLSILIIFAHGPGSPDACTNCRRPGHRYDVCPHPKRRLYPRCGDKHEPQDLTSCIPTCILCGGGGQHLTCTGSCKARNATHKRRSPPPQKTKCPTKKDFPPLTTTLPSTSTWASNAAKTNITTSQDPEVKALREEVKQLRAALSTSNPALPPTPPPPSSSSTPSDQPPQKKRRPDESPAQPIDLEAKFQDLAQNLEANFTERITAQQVRWPTATTASPTLTISPYVCTTLRMMRQLPYGYGLGIDRIPWNDAEFSWRYGFSKQAVLRLLEMLPLARIDNERGLPVPLLLQLLIA